MTAAIRHRPAPRRGSSSTTASSGRIVAWLLILAIVGVVAAAAIVPRVLHAVPLTVLTGSMRPQLQPGDLLIVQPVADADDVAVGDVITFQPVSDDPSLITHRVVAVEEKGGRVVSLTTRGDANGADDEPIVPAQVQGTLRYALPGVGWLASAMTGVRGWVVTIGIIGLFGYAGYAIVRGLTDSHRRRGTA